MKKLILATLIVCKCLAVHAANYYWNPDPSSASFTNDWSDLNNWTTTSGGTIHPSVLPGPGDDVYIEGNSTFPYMMLDVSAECRDFYILGGPLNPEVASLGPSLTVHGSFYGTDAMSLACHIIFASNNTGNTLDLFMP